MNTKNKQTKDDYLKILSELDEITLGRLAELSKNEKARSYFSNPVKYAKLKGLLLLA